ncbi:MAG: V-type ATP synthase subunit E family protein [Treponema sp.]|jgi:V/A-type H+-transporting ATPase subunit E|nr:V-type ATP synthase subunit E family protein [Treponema sp.]
MEELRSTEILDREIQSDARKKAERILSNAELECNNIAASVTGRVTSITKEKKPVYDQKLEQFQRNSDAAIPLEKQRFAVAYIGESVIGAISSYLQSLSEEKRLELISKLLKQNKDVLNGKKLSATVYGCDVEAAKKILVPILGDAIVSCRKTEFEVAGENSVTGLTVHEGIILDSEDHFIHCRFTLEEIISEIQDKYSYELASTLFGGRLPE